MKILFYGLIWVLCSYLYKYTYMFYYSSWLLYNNIIFFIMIPRFLIYSILIAYISVFFYYLWTSIRSSSFCDCSLRQHLRQPSSSCCSCISSWARSTRIFSWRMSAYGASSPINRWKYNILMLQPTLLSNFNTLEAHLWPRCPIWPWGSWSLVLTHKYPHGADRLVSPGIMGTELRTPWNLFEHQGVELSEHRRAFKQLCVWLLKFFQFVREYFPCCQVFSVVTSLLSLAWSFTSYHRVFKLDGLTIPSSIPLLLSIFFQVLLLVTIT